MPCEDVVRIDDEQQLVSELVQHNDADHNHDSSDLCSPFCQCHCCHIHATAFSPLQITFSIPEISTKIFLHFDSLGEDIHSKRLQPPRV